MGPLFNPRQIARTPGFVQDGLYDDLDMAEQDDYERALPPQGGGISAMLAGAPDTPISPIPVKRDTDADARIFSYARDKHRISAPLPSPLREYEVDPSVDPGPQAHQSRQRITLDAAPLPPKPGVMRKILGTAAGLYLPQVGREIMAPGYDRKMLEYNSNRQRMMDEGKLNVQAADEQHKIAAARAQMANAEAAAARKQAELSRAGSYGRPVIHGRPGETIFNQDGGVFATVAPLPPAAKNTIKIGRDGKPFFGEGVEGKDYILADSSVAPSIINSTARPDRGLAALSQLVDKKMPGATQEEKDAEIVRLANEQQKLKEEESKARANRANRVPTGRSGSTTGTATANAEARRKVDEMAKAQIAKDGGVDKAIANMEMWPTRDEAAEKVLVHLRALKGGKLLGGKDKGSLLDAVAAKFEGKSGTTSPSPPTAPPKSTAPAPQVSTQKPGVPAVGTIKGGYKFKGGDPSKPENWEKTK